MKKHIRLISFFVYLIIASLVLCSCSPGDTSSSDSHFFIKVGDRELEREYIGYFFYVAQLNMIREAGMTLGEGGNSTQADVDSFWKTTEIEGRSAVDVARDLAADNAVIQTIQYLKAVSENIKLTTDEEKEIINGINAAIESSGGQQAFNKQLKSMGCDIDAYKQILTENKYVQKLYDKYDTDGKLSVSDEELNAYSQNHSGEIPEDVIFDYAKKDKFNRMAQEWEKEYEIIISDKKMKEFTIKKD